MSGRLLLVAALALATGCAAAPDGDAVRRTCVGKDLRRLSREERRVLAAFHPSAVDAWGLWEVGRDAGAPLFVVAEGLLAQCTADWGNRPVWFDLFIGADGAHLARHVVTVGSEPTALSAMVIEHRLFGPCGVVESTRHGSHTRQFVSLAVAGAHLLRLEDGAGAPVRNNYGHDPETLGPLLPPRDEAEWESDLFGPDPRRRLEALAWLAGEHRWRPDADVVDRLRAKPKVRALLLALARSPDPWERDAARLVKEGPWTR